MDPDSTGGASSEEAADLLQFALGAHQEHQELTQSASLEGVVSTDDADPPSTADSSADIQVKPEIQDVATEPPQKDVFLKPDASQDSKPEASFKKPRGKKSGRKTDGP